MSTRIFPLNISSFDSVFSDRFSRIDRLFSQLTGDNPVSLTPAYNLKQLNEENYELTISVPGWKEKELDIETVGGRLTILGNKDKLSDNIDNLKKSSIVKEEFKWIHKGIQRVNFKLSYSIPEYMEVTTAKLENGLLNIALCMKVPENEKPRRIPIKSSSSNTIEHYK